MLHCRQLLKWKAQGVYSNVISGGLGVLWQACTLMTGVCEHAPQLISIRVSLCLLASHSERHTHTVMSSEYRQNVKWKIKNKDPFTPSTKTIMKTIMINVLASTPLNSTKLFQWCCSFAILLEDGAIRYCYTHHSCCECAFRLLFILTLLLEWMVSDVGVCGYSQEKKKSGPGYMRSTI